MSTRTRLAPVSLPAINLAGTIASSPTILQGLSMLNYAVSWTGTTPVGTLSLQFSDDYSIFPTGLVNNAGTWNTVPLDVNGVFQTGIAISGNTGNGMIDVQATGAYAARLLYTVGSGTGTMNITVTGKVA